MSFNLQGRGLAIKHRLASIPFYGFANQLYYAGLRSSEQLVLPHFICIGLQKAGTTWLYRMLKEHPEIFMSEIKELDFFNRLPLPSLSAYQQHFIEGKRMLKGEISPNYSFMPPARIRFIQKVLPNVKLVLILRNPVKRTCSQLKMRVRKLKLNLDEMKEEDVHRYFQSYFVQQNSDYISIVDNWTSVFGEEQLHICFQEDMRQDAKSFLEEVFQHIGASTNIDWGLIPYQTNFNTGHKLIIPQKYQDFLYELYKPQMKQLEQRFGDPVRRWMR